MLYNILEEKMVKYLRERGFKKKNTLFNVATGSCFTLEGSWEKEGGIILDIIPPTNKNDDEAALTMCVSTPFKKEVIIGWWNNLENFFLF